jgi:hypothetical protein
LFDANPLSPAGADPGGEPLQSMKHLNGVYTQRFNKMNHADGQLVRGRFRSMLVDADTYLRELVRYTHRNSDTIIHEVGTFYHVHKEFLFSSKRGFVNEPRNVAI